LIDLLSVLLHDECTDWGEFLIFICAEGGIPRIRIRIGKSIENKSRRDGMGSKIFVGSSPD
jgi:hypothetical protein